MSDPEPAAAAAEDPSTGPEASTAPEALTPPPLPPAEPAETGSLEVDVPDSGPVPSAHILVLDDDRTTQRFLRYILEKEGYTVTTAGDGVEGLLAMGQGRFDMVLSDIHMPHLDGLELLAQRTRTGIRVPIVVLSADAAESTVRRCLRLGAVDYLRKPVRRDTLLPRVRRALALAASAGDHER